jgi:DNA-binding LacI/PurR family transcriptional regulator
MKTIQKISCNTLDETEALLYNTDMASIRDVAREAGVSPATVSRTFTTPNLINEQTQKRVLEAARLLNYRPPRLRTARPKSQPSLTADIPDAVGFQFFAATPGDVLGYNTFYAQVLSGAQTEAATLGMHLLVHTTNRHSLSQEMPKMVLEQAIGGMLLVGTADPAVLETFAERVPHIVLVDNRDETGTHESILSDGFGGTYAATRYLLENGHKRIGFMLAEEGVTTFLDRLRGYLCALFEAGITPDPRLVLRGQDDETAREASLITALALPATERPTALLTANDHYAFLAMRVCRRLGLSIPNDISLIGFDDIYMSQHTDPPLTTIRVDKEYIGRLAVRRLHARLHTDASTLRIEAPLRHEVPVSLVLRQSCRAL